MLKLARLWSKLMGTEGKKGKEEEGKKGKETAATATKKKKGGSCTPSWSTMFPRVGKKASRGKEVGGNGRGSGDKLRRMLETFGGGTHRRGKGKRERLKAFFNRRNPRITMEQNSRARVFFFDRHPQHGYHEMLSGTYHQKMFRLERPSLGK